MRFFAVFLCLAFLGCKASSSAPAAPPKSPRKVRFIDAPREPDQVQVLVQQKIASSSQLDRKLLVYAGAAWCEPCRRFHEAADKGELDEEFGDVDFLAFDIDIDNERLAWGNYDTSNIPMVALPGPDGKASDKTMNGSVKGEGAVADMKPRLRALLGR